MHSKSFLISPFVGEPLEIKRLSLLHYSLHTFQTLSNMFSRFELNYFQFYFWKVSWAATKIITFTRRIYTIFTNWVHRNEMQDKFIYFSKMSLTISACAWINLREVLMVTLRLQRVELVWANVHLQVLLQCTPCTAQTVFHPLATRRRQPANDRSLVFKVKNKLKA